MLRPSKSIITSTAAACMLLCALGSMRTAEAVPADAKPVGGLRIRLQLPSPEKAKNLPPHCEVIIENVGDSDLNVNLGSSSANGKSHHPTALRLLVRGKGKKKTRALIYSLRVAGRLDPFVVPLPAGSRYTLRIAFDKFADSETGERIDLTAKDYQIAVELVGEAVSKTNADTQGLALAPYWQGKVRSNDVQFLFTKNESDQ